MTYIWDFWEQDGREEGGGGGAEEKGRRQGQQYGIVAPRKDKLTGGKFYKQE